MPTSHLKAAWGRRDSPGAMKTPQGSSLGEFPLLPRPPAAHRDGDGSMVVSCYDNRHMEIGRDA